MQAGSSGTIYMKEETQLQSCRDYMLESNNREGGNCNVYVVQYKLQCDKCSCLVMLRCVMSVSQIECNPPLMKSLKNEFNLQMIPHGKLMKQQGSSLIMFLACEKTSLYSRHRQKRGVLGEISHSLASLM